MKRWVRVGCGRRSAANNVPLSPLRLGCHTLLWSLLTHRRPMSRTISPGLPFIGCCASSDRSSLLNDNRQQLHSHACALRHKNKPVCSTVLQENKHIPHPPARLLPWPFCLGRKINIPIIEKACSWCIFNSPLLQLHVFTYKSEFILCPPQSDLFWMVNEKVSGAIVAIFYRFASPAHLPVNFMCVNCLINQLRGVRLLRRKVDGSAASSPQWKEQFINCSLIGMKDPYNTILRWGD